MSIGTWAFADVGLNSFFICIFDELGLNSLYILMFGELILLLVCLVSYCRTELQNLCCKDVENSKKNAALRLAKHCVTLYVDK